MVFLVLLALTATAIAGAAAFFSVWGLAQLFSGIFWSIVVMGTSLEVGKLVAASYLYRYWTHTNIWLRTYLMLGVFTLMVLTSTGIFGILSAGYQQDVLPLKQKTEQISLLEEEKTRTLARKRQIDNLLASGPTVSNINKQDGTVDNNATRALRETTRSRESLLRQYKVEQADVTKRVSELDRELLTLKQEVIKTEAHIGPITYIAKAFEINSDNATKYLIMVIIFAFDPMAVALTLALNIAIRIRREELDTVNTPAVQPVTPPPSVLSAELPEPSYYPPMPPVQPPAVEKHPVEDQRGILDEVEYNVSTKHAVEDPRGSLDHIVYHTEESPPSVLPQEEIEQELDASPEQELPALPIVPAPSSPIDPTVATSRARFRPYPGKEWTGDSRVPSDKMRELINHHKFLKAKQDNGDTLSRDEAWELEAISDVLTKNGIDMYL